MLRYFGTIDRLTSGLIEDGPGAFKLVVEKQAQLDNAGAFVNVTLAAQPEEDLSRSILAASAEITKLLELAGRYIDRWQHCAAYDCNDPVITPTVQFAGDGLWFAGMFNYSAPVGEERVALRPQLPGMISAARELRE